SPCTRPRPRCPWRAAATTPTPPGWTCTRPSTCSTTSSTACWPSTRASSPTTTAARTRCATAASAEPMAEDPRPSLLIVSGMSGSGKSVAIKTLEDLGYYCTDNLPADLLPDFVRSVGQDEGMPSKLAVGIDVRNRHHDLAS